MQASPEAFLLPATYSFIGKIRGDPMSEATVVTSENSAEFYSKKLDLEPVKTEAEPPKEEAEPVIEEPESQVEEEEPAPEAEEPKPNKLNKRFSELTKQREQALETAQRERERAEQAEQKARELELKLNPPKNGEIGPEPQPSDYTDAFLYAKDLAEWSTGKALKERDVQEQEKRAADARELVVKTWTERQEAVKSEIPDYEEVMASADSIMVSNEVRDAIIESENGPQLAYYLAKNPQEAESLAKLSVQGALIRLGKLEAKLETPDKSAPAPEISKAPAPIAPIKTTNSVPELPVNSAGEFTGTYAQWKKLRQEGKIK